MYPFFKKITRDESLLAEEELCARVFKCVYVQMSKEQNKHREESWLVSINNY